MLNGNHIFKKALEDPLNPAYVVFAASYINTFDKDKYHPEIKEYLDFALQTVLKDPFSGISGKILKCWMDFHEKIGLSSHQRNFVLAQFERQGIINLKKHPNPISVLPLEFSISGDKYVILYQGCVDKNPKCAIFRGCTDCNVQEFLEFRLYFFQRDYLNEFDSFRMSMELVDYDEEIGILIIKNSKSDQNALLNFRTYFGEQRRNDFLSEHTADVLTARIYPLEQGSQIFMSNYIHKAIKLNFSNSQCLVVINAFLRDLVNAASECPLVPYNEKCIRNWLTKYREYYSEFEVENILDAFNSVKLDFLRLRSKKNSKEILPAEIKITNWDFIFTSELGRGGYGVTYNCYVKGVPQDQLVIKLLFRSDQQARESFYNEIVALSRLNRLVVYDASAMVICQKKIVGIPLDVLLQTCEFGSEFERSISVKYMSLAQNFYENYGLIHGDVRPENVIADLNHNLELIDFGMTRSALILGSNTQSHLEQDILKACNEYKYFFSRLDAHRVLENPIGPESIVKILEFLEILKSTKRFKDFQIWSNFLNHKYKSKSN